MKPPANQNSKELIQEVERLYQAERPMAPEEDERVARLYGAWLGSVGQEKARALLHTRYHAVEKMTNGLTAKW